MKRPERALYLHFLVHKNVTVYSLFDYSAGVFSYQVKHRSDSEVPIRTAAVQVPPWIPYLILWTDMVLHNHVFEKKFSYPVSDETNTYLPSLAVSIYSKWEGSWGSFMPLFHAWVSLLEAPLCTISKLGLPDISLSRFHRPGPPGIVPHRLPLFPPGGTIFLGSSNLALLVPFESYIEKSIGTFPTEWKRSTVYRTTAITMNPLTIKS